MLFSCFCFDLYTAQALIEPWQIHNTNTGPRTSPLEGHNDKKYSYKAWMALPEFEYQPHDVETNSPIIANLAGHNEA